MDLGLFLSKACHYLIQDCIISGKSFYQFVSAYNTNFTMQFIIAFVTDTSMILSIVAILLIPAGIDLLYKCKYSGTLSKTRKNIILGSILFDIVFGIINMVLVNALLS